MAAVCRFFFHQVSRTYITNMVILSLSLVSAGDALGQFSMPVSSPAPVNSNATLDAANSDTSPQLATDGDGHWVAVWYGTDPFGTMSGSAKIFCSTSSDNGATWSPMVRVDRYMGVSPSGHSNDPRIATNGQGRWIIVWDSHDTIGGTVSNLYNIMFARSDDNGATWTDMDPLNNLAAPGYNFEEEHAAIASDGGGNWIVVWNMVENVMNAEPGVAMSRSTDNGVTWTDPVIIAPEIALSTEPRIASDGQGRWVVVYHSKNELGGIGNDWDILFTQSTDNGVNWSVQAPLNSHAATDPLGNPGADLYPDIASDGMGNWIAVWISQVDLDGLIGTDEDILYSVSTDHGATWSPTAALNTNAAMDSGGDQFPAIASDGRGHWVTLWNSNANIGGVPGPGMDILAAGSDDNGATWTAPAVFNSSAAMDIGTDTDQRAAVATDGLGNWLGVWMSNFNLGGVVGTDYDIFAAGAVIPVCEVGGVDEDCDGNGIADRCEDDTDGDGAIDVCDNCPAVGNAGQEDADADGIGDLCDGCPGNPIKSSPGLCGCNSPDTDSDGDGVPDCVEPPPPQALPGCCAAGALAPMGYLMLCFVVAKRARRRTRASSK